MNIKQIAEIANLSTEAIRFYEKLGIITPERNPNNGYRTYDLSDVLTVLHCSQYQRLGFSLKEINQAINEESPDYFLKKLYEKKDFLEKEIQQKQEILDVIDKYITSLEVSEYNIGSYWFEKRESILIKKLDNLTDNDKVPKDVCMWFSHMPIVRGCYCLNGKSDSAPAMSMFVEKNYADLHTELMRGSAILDEQICLCTIVKVPYEEPFDTSLLEDAFNYLKKRNMEQDGIITAGIMVRNLSEKEAVRYFKVLIPVARV